MMRPRTSGVTFTWCTPARSPTAVSRLGITSTFASATLTEAGGGLLLAKNCVIILVRNALKPTNPPTSTASSSPTIMNQRVILTGRARGFSVIALPEILASVTIFMSCPFCNYRLPRLGRQFPVQVRGNHGFVKANSAENEFVHLPFEIGGFVLGKGQEA